MSGPSGRKSARSVWPSPKSEKRVRAKAVGGWFELKRLGKGVGSGRRRGEEYVGRNLVAVEIELPKSGVWVEVMEVEGLEAETGSELAVEVPGLETDVSKNAGNDAEAVGLGYQGGNGRREKTGR